MKIDAHQHFWQYNDREYGWIGEGMELLKSDHLPSDLEPLMASVGVGGTIAVQARQTFEETGWLLDLADRYRFVKGVVGWLDLRSPGLSEQLEQVASRPKLCGVRHVLHDEADDRFMLREGFVKGIGMLARYGLTYDLLLFPQHLPWACELVGMFPDQPFVLDHIAKPPIKQGVMEPWAVDLRRLASYPNVYCKVSGLVTEADSETWTAADIFPYLDVAFEAFGPGRVMFGSDWPVCTVVATYREVFDIVSDYAAQLSEAEQADLWTNTAIRFYGLE